MHVYDGPKTDCQEAIRYNFIVRIPVGLKIK